MSDRTFSKDEVAALLERTAELERAGNRQHASSSSGLTLSELEHVAQEAGLDVDLLRSAVSELDDRSSLEGIRRNISATHNTLERWVDGTMSEDTWADLVMELRNRYDTDMGASMGMPGFGMSAAETLGRNRQWRHTSLMGVEQKVLFREIDGRTRIRMSQKVGMASPLTESLMYGGILAAFGTLIAGAALNSGAMSIVAFFAMVLLFVPLVLQLDKGWRRKKHNQLALLSEEIVRHIQASESTGELDQDADQNLDLDLDELQDFDESGRSTSSARTRS